MIIKFICQFILSCLIIYGLGYFLTNELNIMLWGTTAKVLFLIIIGATINSLLN